MFGKKFDRLTVRYRIRLGQVSHGFDQLPLPVNVARIRSPLASLAPYLRRDRDGENLSHKRVCCANRSLFALSSLLYEWLAGSIPSCSRFFSFYLSTGNDWSDNHTFSCHPGALPLRRYKLGLARRLQLENGIRNLLIQLNIGVFGQAVIARRIEQLLLN